MIDKIISNFSQQRRWNYWWPNHIKCSKQRTRRDNRTCPARTQPNQTFQNQFHWYLSLGRCRKQQCSYTIPRGHSETRLYWDANETTLTRRKNSTTWTSIQRFSALSNLYQWRRLKKLGNFESKLRTFFTDRRWNRRQVQQGVEISKTAWKTAYFKFPRKIKLYHFFYS